MGFKHKDTKTQRGIYHFFSIADQAPKNAAVPWMRAGGFQRGIIFRKINKLSLRLCAFALKKTLITAAVIGLAACGVKGPPLPPIQPVPPAPAKMAARAREGCAELSWSAAPVKRPEDAVAAQWEVMRAKEPKTGESPAFQVLDRTIAPTYQDCSLGAGERAVYEARGISKEGKPGPPSPPMTVENLAAPAAFLSLRTVAGDRFIELSWQAPPDLPAGTGFNLYRSEDPTAFPWRPLNPEVFSGTTFADGPLANGTRYYYQVRAARVEKGLPVAEGPAATASAVPVDRVPPSPPMDFAAAPSLEGTVVMRWMPNREIDLKGYIVYRKEVGVTDFLPLVKDPVTETSYTDATARRGVEYEYAVTAIDTATPPNQSPLSEVQAIYLEPGD